ncbi:cytochrome P450 [Nocardia sp. BMG51109]|uniref:cytochrome P450 n=1 Tax=Nocardia sp. BMG51109 TaxID=1056816 RepID=UPI000467178F|nr:cytochrome P450 [Nocardia sp. BMG51109]
MTTAELDYVRFDENNGVYVVSGFDEISTILREPGWSSDPRRNPLIPAEIQAAPPSVLLFMDPPDHTRLRRLVGPAFTPRSMNALRPRVADIVDTALDQLDDDAELISEFAYVVPLAVIAEFLDVGSEGAEVFREHTPAITRLLEIDPSPAELVAGMDASLEIMLYLAPVIADRKRNPGDDFLSALLAQEDLAVDEVASTCILLLGAGHETTANLIGNGTQAILSDPAQRDHLSADPGRAIEELLRVQGPVKLLSRTATADHLVAGHEIPSGSVVVMELRRANADPRRFDDPLRLDLSRTPVQHVAFGGGAHFCLGAALTRLETSIALPALFDGYPGMRLVHEVPDWRDSTTFHGLNTLPLHLR